MDDRQFDSLARSLARAQSRRGLLKALGGAMAAALGSAATPGLEAANCPPPRVCGDGCCPAGSMCQNSQCSAGPPAGCPAGQNRCTGVCTDLTTTANCGACGNVCPAPADPCLVAACQSGACGFVAGNDGAPCNDGDACTQTDYCQGGVCIGTNPVVCPNPDQCHDPGVCDLATGLCSNPAKADDTPCNDGNACTTPDSCQGGVCVGREISCDDGLDCTIASCDPANGCMQTLQDGSCLIDGACVESDKRNPDNPCQGCDPTQSTAAWTSLPFGASCADDSLCNGDEACDGQGACQSGIPVECPPPDQCHLPGVCNPGTGQCSYAAKGNGFPCDDGDLCTIGDTCQNGVCVGGSPPGCNPILSCNRLLGCDPATGGCLYEPADEDELCGPGVTSSCSAFRCQSGQCREVVHPDYCLIDEACKIRGTWFSNLDLCHLCIPEVSQTDWSAQQDGGFCSGDDVHICCDAVCIDRNADNDHCGTCGNSCGGRRCCSGECKATTFDGECPCGEDNPCSSSLTCCFDVYCADFLNDPGNCGACDLRCSGSFNEVLCCDGVCANNRNTVTCGSCDNDCSSQGDSCVLRAGEFLCVCGGGLPCPAGTICCNGACINPLTDRGNCGRCGRACTFVGSGGLILNGECCDGACTNTLTDPENCGACGNECSGPLLVGTCVAGGCLVQSCPAGMGNCDGDIDNGCEIDLRSDVDNCGACGNVCPCQPNSVCVNGSCCTASRASCECGFNAGISCCNGAICLNPIFHNTTC